MKLELKHLAPYLPYGLKMKYKGGDAIEEMEAHHLAINYEYNFKDRFEIILRPLSDLTKKIDLNKNGDEFCFMSVYFQVDGDEEDKYNIYGTIPEYWKHALKVGGRYWDYWQTEILFEYHFDVFGLIEKGLAIDINTL